MKTLCSKISNYIKTLIKRNQIHRTAILKDGTSITRPFSYSLISMIITLSIFMFFWNLIVSAFFKRFGVGTFFSNFSNFFTIIKRMILEVNWSYFNNVLGPMADTIRIAVLDSLFGKEYPIDSLRYIPFSEGKEFRMAQDSEYDVVRRAAGIDTLVATE